MVKQTQRTSTDYNLVEGGRASPNLDARLLLQWLKQKCASAIRSLPTTPPPPSPGGVAWPKKDRVLSRLVYCCFHACLPKYKIQRLLKYLTYLSSNGGVVQVLRSHQRFFEKVLRPMKQIGPLRGHVKPDLTPPGRVFSLTVPASAAVTARRSLPSRSPQHKISASERGKHGHAIGRVCQKSVLDPGPSEKLLGHIRAYTQSRSDLLKS